MAESNVGMGWLLFVVAAALFIAAFGHIAPARMAGGGFAIVRPRAVTTASVAWPLVGLSLIAVLVAIYFFGTEATTPAAWMVYAVSVLLFIAAFIRINAPDTQRPRAPHRSTSSVLIWLAAAVVVMSATVLRLWQLADFPFGVWYDEAANGLVARQIIAEPGYRPVYVAISQMPAHFNYLVAGSFAVFQESVWSIRFVSALLGIVSVVFAYLLFSRWFGGGMGLFAAGILAVLRYHLTFSRLGMNGIATPAFELACLYFLDRALDGRRPADFAGLGMALGFGLGFYIAFRLFLPVVGMFLLVLFAFSAARDGVRSVITRYIVALRFHWLLAALGLLITAAPVAQLAINKPELFFSRSGTVSIFEKRDEPDLAKALWSNTRKHLEMFNVLGDRNGRHNLPGAPMLDPVMGVLFVVGVALALWRWRDPPNGLMLLLFGIMLLAGILSLDFEAPQSYRAIGVIPALVYFISLPVAAVARAAHRQVTGKRVAAPPGIPRGLWRRRLPVSIALLASLLLGLGALEITTFFGPQQADASAWAAYSTPETLAAYEVNAKAAQYDFLASALYMDPPTVRFLQRPGANVRRWVVSDRLPAVREDDGRGLILLLDRGLLSAFDEARRLYPAGQFIEHTAPRGGGVVMYEVILSPEVLRSVQGVAASYFAGEPAFNSAAHTESVSNLKVDWTSTAPLAEPFFAELRSTLVVKEYGEYRFATRGELTASLWIDEFVVGSEPVELALGTHALRWQVTGGTGGAELLWQPPSQTEPQPVPAQNLFVSPVTNSGLLGAYYPTPDWSGSPAFTQVDPQLAYYFHIIPLPRPYSVRWTGKLFAPGTGDYGFEIFSVDGSKLMLDGQMIVDNPEGRKSVTGAASLAQGWHDVQVDFSDRTSGTQIYLYWTRPAGERELVPAEYLSPPMGAYPSSP